MAITARQLIEDARDLHPAFDDNTHPDAIMVRALNRLQMELMQAAVVRYPSLYDTTQDLNLVDIDFVLGNPLLSPFYIQDLSRFSQGIESPLYLVPFEHRFDGNEPYLRAWIRDGRVFLPPPAAIWNGVDSIRIYYAGTLPQLATLDDTLVLPDESRGALSLALAEIMAARGTQRQDITAPSAAYFAAKAVAERERFLTALWLLRSVENRFIRDVGP